ncbi:molybdopterin molybdotransferase MoeA [Ectobacillus ponti]|uniref:Molybdopterin molybdenumtransferase n=1 Tax=Ectobacillus ponti TaxID=2961894 RepID=A0AA41X651_9BACI|nr:gephyrin-like molybdotransferase Glp [Ectobacillus ponti]MCP8967535.1 molybdopterin molybdotransferase MoeA [Ectobacillus ponti]
MTLMRKPIPVAEAVQRVMQFPRLKEAEAVKLEESTGRVLAQDIYTTHPVPWFTRSPYDGYAICAASTEQAGEGSPVWLQVLGTVAAGDVWRGCVERGQAVKIMTGGAMPDGADAVIMRELTREEERDGALYVQIKRKVKTGENISRIGEDMEEGELLLRQGTMINAGTVAQLATFGYAEVPVFRKPVVAVIATGSELLDPSEPLAPGKIRNSNGYMLLSQVLRSGAEPLYIGKVQDTLGETLAAVKKALEQADLVLTTGGVSVGDFDYIPAVYQELGAQPLFNKIGMRPGSVTSAAERNGKLLFGLSGNPSACYVGFELFARPVIRAMMGMKRPYSQRVQAELQEDFTKPNPFDRFVRGKLSFSGGRLYAAPSGKDKSNIVSSLAEANCLIVLPGGTRGWEAGSMVDVLLLDDQEGTGQWR